MLKAAGGWLSRAGNRYKDVLSFASPREIDMHVPVLPLSLAPDIEYNGEHDDTGKRYEMRQLKREPIKMVVLVAIKPQSLGIRSATPK